MGGLTNAARGGYYSSPPSDYPAGAVFSNKDVNGYKKQLRMFAFLSVSSLLGVHQVGALQAKQRIAANIAVLCEVLGSKERRAACLLSLTFIAVVYRCRLSLSFDAVVYRCHLSL